MKNQGKILLLAFRKSQKEFFSHMLKEEGSENFYLKETRKLFLPSFSSLKHILKLNIGPACDFAVDELIAKTSVPFPKSVTRFVFQLLAYFTYVRYYKLLDQGWEKMLIWNGGKFRQLIAIEIARLLDIKVIYFENGLLPNRIVLDTKGINFNNSVPREKAFFENYENNKELPTQLIPRKPKHLEKFTADKIDLPQKYIFVPFQVDYDTQIITQSKFIKNMRHFFDVIEIIAKNTPYHFILKEHPSSGVNYPDLHKRADAIDNISFANGYATQELIEKSSAVMCVNSTVGIESLLFKKRVIVLGSAFYAIEGITFPAPDMETLTAYFEDFDALSFNEVLVEKFLKYLYYDYQVARDDDMYKNFVAFMRKH